MDLSNRRFIGLNVSFLALVILFFGACKDEPGQELPQNGNGHDPNPDMPQEGERRLAVVGSPLIQMETNGQARLTVVLVKDEVGPIPNEPVRFEVFGNPAGSSFADGLDSSVLTNDQGMASVDLTAGSSQTTFQVTASATGATPVAFSVQVSIRQHRISIVRTPNVRVAASGTQATVEIGAFSRVLLRVRINDQFGRPIQDAAVRYSFDQPARSASFEGANSSIMTNPSGEAQMSLDTGDDLDDTFVITARTEASATATWNIRLEEQQTRICNRDADCGPGLYCRNGICQGSAHCSNEEPVIGCPPGYRCVVNECQISVGAGCVEDGDCLDGYTCIDGQCVTQNPHCEDDFDCPSGFECHAGVCVGQPGMEVPDISGGWYTAHYFDIQEALPGILGSAAGPLREIHRILIGEINLPFFLAWLEPLIQGIIDEYIPPWVTTVVMVLDNLLTVMSDMRAQGYMSVNQSGPIFSANEVWDSFIFYFLPMCGPVPPSDPTPDCARVDLFVDDLTDDVTLGLRIHPFNGTVTEIRADNTATVLIEERKIDMNIARIVRWVADELVDILTEFDDLESAVLASVDCRALGQSAESLGPGVGSLVEQACNGAVGMILNQVDDMLTGVAFDLGMLKIEGEATIHDINVNNYAGLLGYPDFETRRDGSWNGRFAAVVKGVPGAWHGSRRPLP